MKASRIISVLVVFFLYSIFTSAVFAAGIANDSILSQHIKEADGTSGQNTNSGSGVKTGHIQDGAVTDAKVAGPISASKIAGLDSTYQKKISKVAIVAQSGGDYASPAAAMNNIGAWCGTPSATNPCLIMVMPGVYNLGGSPISLQSFVSIKGSGQNVTKIIGTVEGGVYNQGGLINTAPHVSISDVSIENSGGYYRTQGIYVVSSDSVTISNTDINVSSSQGIVVGMVIASSSNILVKNNTINAALLSGGASASAIAGGQNSNLTLDNITAVVGIGSQQVLAMTYSTMVIKNSTLINTNPSGMVIYHQQVPDPDTVIEIVNSDLRGTNILLTDFGKFFINNTKLAGNINAGVGPVTCINTFDANYMPVTCQ